MKLHKSGFWSADRFPPLRALLGIVLACTGIFLANALVCLAETPSRQPVYTNPDTGYSVVVEDDAGLLTGEECEELAAVMKKITAYGNAAFKTVAQNSSSTERLAGSYYKERFGTDSGTLFLIDMDNRNIWIFSDGAIYKTVTSSYADTVTDNVYRYAGNGDYYTCGVRAFEQIYDLLEGNRIAQPMKYISNALLAVILSLLINFGLVRYFSKLKSPGEGEILKSIEKKFTYTEPVATYTHTSKRYDPVSSSSGGSSGGGSSGGSSGGGSSSGGGGGHSF